MDRRQRMEEEQRLDEEYAEWLMQNEPERITSGDALLRLMQAGVRYNEFINQRGT